MNGQVKVFLLTVILGRELLIQLLDITQHKLTNLLEGETPSEISKDCLDFLHQLVIFLLGTYTHSGIRRWFVQRKVQLAGRSPLEILLTHRQWHLKQPDIEAIYRLAQRVS